MAREDDHDLSDVSREAGWSALALSLKPIEPAADVRARLLQSLRGPERFTLYTAEVARAFGLTPESAREALAAIHDASGWRAGPFPGSSVLSTPALERAGSVITRLRAGTRIRMHEHVSREATFVLDGLLREDGTRAHGPGTLLEMHAGSQHELEVDAGGECLVVFSLARP